MTPPLKARIRTVSIGRAFLYRSSLSIGSRLRPLRVLGIVLLGSLLLAGSIHSQSERIRDSANGADRVHLGDSVEVDFIGSFQFDWRGRLTEEGYLDGLERARNPVFALCRTEGEIAAAVAQEYSYFLRDPEVVVRILDRSNRALAYVNGAVRTQQRFQLRRSARLLELLVLSGGITDNAAGRVVIFRPPNVSCTSVLTAADVANARPERIEIAIADILGGKPEANPKILTGDVVNVIEAPPVFVMGDVVLPKRMNLTPDLTLSRAIASAGGLSRSFSGQKVRIHRAVPEPTVIEYDLRRILDSKESDPTLRAYDVIEVEQKGVEAGRIAPVSEPRPTDREALSRLPLRIVD